MAQERDSQPGSKPRLLSQKEYADQKGWSKQYVHQLVKKGRIPLHGGKIDPVVADAALARDRDPTRAPPFRADSMAQLTPPDAPGQPDPTGPHGSFSKARAVREHFRALRERLEYEHLVGKLVVVQEVEDAVLEAARDVSESFAGAAARIGIAIAGKFELDERQVHDIVTSEVRSTLQDLSRRFTEKCLTFKEAEPPESAD